MSSEYYYNSCIPYFMLGTVADKEVEEAWSVLIDTAKRIWTSCIVMLSYLENSDCGSTRATSLRRRAVAYSVDKLCVYSIPQHWSPPAPHQIGSGRNAKQCVTSDKMA